MIPLYDFSQRRREVCAKIAVYGFGTKGAEAEQRGRQQNRYEAFHVHEDCRVRYGIKIYQELCLPLTHNALPSVQTMYVMRAHEDHR